MADGPAIQAVFPPQKPATPPAALQRAQVQAVQRFHRSLPGYRVTPLYRLPALARHLGVRDIYVKDESHRFGLKAFKALGATWALARILGARLGYAPGAMDFPALRRAAVRLGEMVFVTATDGNHGRGLAWAAAQLGCRAVVFMPAGSSPHRVSAIAAEGAEVRVTEVNYDDAVRMAAGAAAEHGWHLVQDTALPGYEEIPVWIVQGYTTMAAEVLEQLEEKVLPRPTHLLLQAGVGSLAASVLGYYANVLGSDCPQTLIVEPDQADCLFRSALADDGTPRTVGGALATIMAGLACGEPNPWAWRVLRDFAAGFVSCPDAVAALGMRQLARPCGDDPPIVSGESGAVGVGLLCRLATDAGMGEVKERFGLGPESVVLCFSTEGDTDPESYRAIVDRPAP